VREYRTQEVDAYDINFYYDRESDCQPIGSTKAIARCENLTALGRLVDIIHYAPSLERAALSNGAGYGAG